MAKAAVPATEVRKSPKFYVALPGYRITGLTDSEGTRYEKRPHVLHTRPRDDDGKVEGQPWLAPDELQPYMDARGVSEFPTRKDDPKGYWPQAMRPLRSGLRADLFEGCVIATAQRGEVGEMEAVAVFKKRFGVNKTTQDFVVKALGDDARPGLANPVKGEREIL